MANLRFGSGITNASLQNRQRAVNDLATVFDYYESLGRIQDAISVALTRNTSLRGLHSVRKRALEMVEPGSLDEGRLPMARFRGAGQKWARTNIIPGTA